MCSNKYSNGSVLVVGGNEVYTGAPVLSSFAANAVLSALRTGTGYATLLVERGIADVEKSISPNLIVRSFEESKGKTALLRAIAGIRHNVLVIGPGVGKGSVLYRSAAGIVMQELGKGNIIVADAGVQEALAVAKAMLSRNVILTPHRGELAKMGLQFHGDDLHAMMVSAAGIAMNLRCTLVFKGHETIITDGRITKVNRASTPALATMGTGDVLAGMIAAYAAVHRDAFESAVAGVTAHSMIGDMLCKRMGNHVIATDLINAIPRFLKKFDRVT